MLSRDTTDKQFGVTMTLSHLPLTPWRLVGAAVTWHLSSQQQARRNALSASTVLAQRRKELVDVEEFLTRHAPAASRSA